MSQTILTHDRSILMLEGLWDQLESVASAMRSSDDQPRVIGVVRSRVNMYGIRLREVIANVQGPGVRGAESETQRSLTTAMIEVAELLDGMQAEPPNGWVVTIYRAQDAVLASLHEMRRLARAKESTCEITRETASTDADA